MAQKKLYEKVSDSPTNPKESKREKTFDVADLYKGPVSATGVEEKDRPTPLDEKLRQAYFWITNHAIISPFYDIEYQEGPSQHFTFGDQKISATLPSGQSYSSYVLLPLLNLAVRRRCLLVGGPGRGKTVIAMIMGVLGGYTLKEIKRAIQHGQPQMTCLVYVKAMAYFRGAGQVSFEDVRQIIPFVLHDKLVQNVDSPAFEKTGFKAHRTDFISWIRYLFDASCADYDRMNLDKDDPVAEFETEFEKGLEGVSEKEISERLIRIERTLGEWSKGRKFYGHMFDDILKMKYLHQRYTNYLRWLKWKDA